MNILITGAAGFIGFHTSIELLGKGHKIFGIDSLNRYYSVKIKQERLKLLRKIGKKNFYFFKNNLTQEKYLLNLIKKHKISIIIHLAAQAGVRHSLEHPMDYIKNNIIPTTNLLEATRKSKKIKHFLLASTSSVYASSIKTPFDENDPADFPLQFYAATKRSTELMAHSFSHLYSIPFTVLRFFSVYGTYGRPDMALFKFTKNILENKKIEVFNNGNHTRDFTYVSDIAKSIEKLILKIPNKNEKFNLDKKLSYYSNAKIRYMNIGSGRTEPLKKYIKVLEKTLGKKAKKKYLPFQVGDALKTSSNIKKLKKIINFTPRVKIESGIKNFVEWYKSYYKIK
jgi:UDP-glucuronate 4-epimerase